MPLVLMIRLCKNYSKNSKIHKISLTIIINIKIKFNLMMHPPKINIYNPLIHNMSNPLIHNMSNPLIHNMSNPLIHNMSNPLIHNMSNPLIHYNLRIAF